MLINVSIRSTMTDVLTNLNLHASQGDEKSIRPVWQYPMFFPVSGELRDPFGVFSVRHFFPQHRLCSYYVGTSTSARIHLYPQASAGSVNLALDRMRTVSRLLASVKPARFLEPGNPTGLTGLFTHDAPRSTLLFLYGLTLDKLKAIPEHSVYRQSAERIIKHRMKIVESIKAKGYDEWAQRAEKMFEEHPHIFNSTASGPRRLVSHGRPTFITAQHEVEEDEQDAEWDGEEEQRNQGEDEDQPLQWVDGKDGVEYKDGQKVLVGTSNPQPAEEKATENVPGQVGRSLNPQSINWEPEPQLEASQ